MGGGDYDGDTYFVIVNPLIVAPVSQWLEQKNDETKAREDPVNKARSGRVTRQDDQMRIDADERGVRPYEPTVAQEEEVLEKKSGDHHPNDDLIKESQLWIQGSKGILSVIAKRAKSDIFRKQKGHHPPTLLRILALILNLNLSLH